MPPVANVFDTINGPRVSDLVTMDSIKAVAMHREDHLELLQQAAELGDLKAQFCLSTLYHTGDGVQQDSMRTAGLLQQAAAQGIVEAQCTLGQFHQLGIGVEHDSVMAVALYQHAADQGDVVAQCSLGIAYKDDNGAQQYSERVAALLV